MGQVARVAPLIEHTCLDNEYVIPTLAYFRALLDHNLINRAAYILDNRDCEDFALKVMSDFRWHFGMNGIGLVLDNRYQDAVTGFVYSHAYNLCLFVDSQPLVLEPQTDDLWVPGTQGYRMQAGKLLL